MRYKDAYKDAEDGGRRQREVKKKIRGVLEGDRFRAI